MAGKFEMETSTAGIFRREESMTGSPVSGLPPDGTFTGGLEVEVGTVVGTGTVGVKVEVAGGVPV